MNVLAILPGFIPSTIIGVLRPLAALEQRREINFRLRLYNVSVLASRDIEWCDVAVFCRNCEIKDLPILYELKRKGKKIVYELDDNFEEIPLTTDIGLYHRSFFRLHVIKRFFALSDITRVYSDRLLQRSVTHGARPQLIRSYFDQSIVKGLQRPAHDGVIKIAYPTGRIDDNELEERIFSAVRLILQKYETKVEFHLWRKTPPRQLLGVKGVVLNKGVRSYDAFMRSFFKAGYDIGLAPGVDTPFFHSKTNNKYREFGGCGVAGIYSNFPPYSNSVVHEQSGLLVESSTEQWVAAIERLVLDANLRAKIVRGAAEDVLVNYSFEAAVESWRECFRLLSERQLDMPTWLPSLDHSPVFAFVNLASIDEDDCRHAYLPIAINSIPGVLSVQFSSASEYLKSPLRRSVTASIFFLANETELQTISTLLPLTVSVIVDVTKYANDVEAALCYLRKAAAGVPTTFLVSLKDAEMSTWIASAPDCVVLKETEYSPVAQEFSLTGYPAAYLDIAERHVHFSAHRIKLDRFFRLPYVVGVMVDRYTRWKGRFETIFMLIKWRLGLRHF